jgi:hypothetical protein
MCAGSEGPLNGCTCRAATRDSGTGAFKTGDQSRSSDSVPGAISLLICRTPVPRGRGFRIRNDADRINSGEFRCRTACFQVQGNRREPSERSA